MRPANRDPLKDAIELRRAPWKKKKEKKKFTRAPLIPRANRKQQSKLLEVKRG